MGTTPAAVASSWKKEKMSSSKEAATEGKTGLVRWAVMNDSSAGECFVSRFGDERDLDRLDLMPRGRAIYMLRRQRRARARGRGWVAFARLKTRSGKGTDGAEPRLTRVSGPLARGSNQVRMFNWMTPEGPAQGDSGMRVERDR